MEYTRCHELETLSGSGESRVGKARAEWVRGTGARHPAM